PGLLNDSTPPHMSIASAQPGLEVPGTAASDGLRRYRSTCCWNVRYESVMHNERPVCVACSRDIATTAGGSSQRNAWVPIPTLRSADGAISPFRDRPEAPAALSLEPPSADKLPATESGSAPPPQRHVSSFLPRCGAFRAEPSPSDGRVTP